MEEANKIENGGFVTGGANLGMKVMTDEQLEMLRKQICVYITISESLVQMHKSMSAHHDFTGMRVPSPYNAQFLSYAYHKIPSRQRWAPKQAQLQILESIFQQSSATPDRQRIKDITNQLAVYGPVSETNVYNWFQNRRARSKRKQQASATVETEAATEPSSVSAKDKQIVSDDPQLDENLAYMINHMYYQSPEIGGIDEVIGKTEAPVDNNSFLQ